MFAILGGGAVGLMDDWIKVVRERNLGLSKRAKFFGLIAVATIFGISMVRLTAVNTHLSFTRPTTLDLTEAGWVIFAVLLIVGSSNAVNLTDGLDGLAAGSAILCFSAYTVIPFWQFRHADAYGVDHALDLAVISASMVGALVGFLWWNAAPARIFMGDTGSLAIGSGLAALALATDTQLLLGIVGGLFVMETASVMLQVARFRIATAVLPHGADPSSLRARRLARDDGHHPFLDPLGPLHGRGPRDLLRRFDRKGDHQVNDAISTAPAFVLRSKPTTALGARDRDGVTTCASSRARRDIDRAISSRCSSSSWCSACSAS